MYMDDPNISMIAQRFEDAVETIDVPPAAKSFADRPQEGSWHVEKDAEGYAMIFTERGGEIWRKQTADPDELLYWLVESVAFNDAIRFEFENRIAGRDHRELLFARHEEVLSEIKPEWGERKRAEHKATLAKHPLRHRF